MARAEDPTRYVAFLRGINLGKRRVSMDELRRPFEEAGLDGVATFIASGNVVFDDPGEPRDDLERRIERHVEAALGFGSDTMLRTLPEVGALTRHEGVARGEADGRTVFVTFAKSPLGPTVARAFAALETPDDGFVVLEREVLWLRRGGISDSTIKTPDLERAFGGVPNTRRKVDTLRRLVAKFAE